MRCWRSRVLDDDIGGLLMESSLVAGQLGGNTQRLEHTAFVGDALARDVEGRAVINGSADYGQADGYVYAGLQPHYLDGRMTLIMIHRHHQVEVAAGGPEEQ